LDRWMDRHCSKKQNCIVVLLLIVVFNDLNLIYQLIKMQSKSRGFCKFHFRLGKIHTLSSFNLFKRKGVQLQLARCSQQNIHCCDNSPTLAKLVHLVFSLYIVFILLLHCL
jgi:hypothetical protein